MGAVAEVLVSLKLYRCAKVLGKVRLRHPTSGHLVNRTATDKPRTTLRKSSEKEKGGIREEVDAADYSGSVQGGGENRSQLKDSRYAAAAQLAGYDISALQQCEDDWDCRKKGSVCHLCRFLRVSFRLSGLGYLTRRNGKKFV